MSRVDVRHALLYISRGSYAVTVDFRHAPGCVLLRLHQQQLRFRARRGQRVHDAITFSQCRRQREQAHRPCDLQGAIAIDAIVLARRIQLRAVIVRTTDPFWQRSGRWRCGGCLRFLAGEIHASKHGAARAAHHVRRMLCMTGRTAADVRRGVRHCLHDTSSSAMPRSRHVASTVLMSPRAGMPTNQMR